MIYFVVSGSPRVLVLHCDCTQGSTRPRIAHNSTYIDNIVFPFATAIRKYLKHDIKVEQTQCPEAGLTRFVSVPVA